MPLSLAGITTADHLQESGLKSKWEVWREYAYKASLAVVSLFVLAPQVNYNCVECVDCVHKSVLSMPQANAVNSYCKTHCMPAHTRYSTLTAFLESIFLYLVSNFWIYLYGSIHRLRYLEKLSNSILDLHMEETEIEQAIDVAIKDSPPVSGKSKAVRENLQIFIYWGSDSILWKSYVVRCVILWICLIWCILLSCC